VSVERSGSGGGLDWVSTIVPHLAWWSNLVASLATPLLLCLTRFVAERQRRATLVTLMREAPGGTVVILDKGLGGPAMCVWIGDGRRTPKAVRHAVVRSMATQPSGAGHGR
jgi:hypothetical protein